MFGRCDVADEADIHAGFVCALDANIPGKTFSVGQPQRVDDVLSASVPHREPCRLVTKPHIGHHPAAGPPGNTLSGSIILAQAAGYRVERQPGQTQLARL
jgi:hypothetical protein